MASGPYFDQKRGTYSIQYWDRGWHRVDVYKIPGWNPKDAKPKKEPTVVLKKKIELEEIETAAKQLRGKGLPDDLKAFLDERTASYQNETTRENFRITAAQFLAWCAAQKIVAFQKVDTDVCARWIADSLKTLAVSTVQTKRGQLAGAWSEIADRKRYANPWIGAKLKAKVKIKRRGGWSPEQFASLLAVCRPWLRNVLIFGVHTGLRIKALMLLEWGDIEFADANHKGDRERFGIVRVRSELDKAGKGYVVPMSPTLHDCIQGLKRDGDIVLKGHLGKPIGARGNTASAIVRACHKAGLPKPDSPNHHMRRTFGRWAIKGYLDGDKADIYTVMKLLGHASTNMTVRYLDLEDEELHRFVVPKRDQEPKDSSGQTL